MFPDLSFLERKVYRQIIREMRCFHKYCVDIHKKMNNLIVLKMGKNDIEDLSPLKNLKNLKIVELFENMIEDISQIKIL